MDATFWGWGGHGAKTRTRDRGTEPVAKKLKATGIWTGSCFRVCQSCAILASIFVWAGDECNLRAKC